MSLAMQRDAAGEDQLRLLRFHHSFFFLQERKHVGAPLTAPGDLFVNVTLVKPSAAPYPADVALCALADAN